VVIAGLKVKIEGGVGIEASWHQGIEEGKKDLKKLDVAFGSPTPWE